MKFILGKKLEMSQMFDAEGNAIPVTLVQAGPVVITQLKYKEKDGYDAVQVGFGEKKEKNIKKPQKGHLKKSQITNHKSQNVRWMREFRPAKNSQFPISPDSQSESRTLDSVKQNRDNFQTGDVIDVSSFKEGDIVDVSGISKGKGFQGVVKRHGFHGGPRTHGQKHSEREPGSIGATGPQRVFKGTRMAGRMGGERVTVRNLKIVKVEPEKNLLAIQGAVPGARGTLLEIKQNV